MKFEAHSYNSDSIGEMARCMLDILKGNLNRQVVWETPKNEEIRFIFNDNYPCVQLKIFRDGEELADVSTHAHSWGHIFSSSLRALSEKISEEEYSSESGWGYEFPGNSLSQLESMSEKLRFFPE
ncbi:hypothetical protein QUF80_06215 [Desulfococcaceae bacterium HSG8]|nr:hypothetical protein [Desulfococcaceae bacterium HSG8]